MPNRESLPTPSLVEKEVEAGADRYQTPDSVLVGWPEEFNALTEKIYADFNKKHGTDFKFQLKKQEARDVDRAGTRRLIVRSVEALRHTRIQRVDPGTGSEPRTSPHPTPP